VKAQFPAASIAQAITAAQGGSVSLATGSGANVTVTIPAGALASNATVTVATVAATVKALPGNAAPIGAFTIDTGGVALQARLVVAFTLTGSVPSADVLRVARYSTTSGAYADVDTVTLSGTSAQTNDAVGYVGISSASAADPYALYAIAASAAATPSPITLGVSLPTPGPYAIASSLVATATGSDANGDPYVYAPTFTVSAGLGTATPSTSDPLAATIAFATVPTTGTIAVADARTKTSGSATVTTSSQVPLSAAQTFAFAGSSTVTQYRSVPAPMPTATTVATVQQTGTLKDQQTWNGVSGLYDASVAEIDTTALQTSTSQTDTYEAFSTPSAGGGYDFLEYGSTWADDNQDTLTSTYPTPLVLDRLPEVAQDSWTNSPAVTILENDTTDTDGTAFSSTTTYAADGSYTEATTFPPNYATGGQSVITENADGSGSITNVLGTTQIVFSAPAPLANGEYEIPFAVYLPQTGSTPYETSDIPAWFAVPVSLYQETDKNLGAQSIPLACNVPASVATSATKVERTTTRVDTILGYTDTQTVDEYRVLALGAVCVQMSDAQSLYYDFNDDQQFLFDDAPYQVNTTVETLGLQSGASPQSAHRRGAAAVTASPFSTEAIAAARTRFERTILRARATRTLSAVRRYGARLLQLHGGAR